MVKMPKGYCIDSTEVTRSQYAAWLTTGPQTAGQVASCSWNNTYLPNTDYAPAYCDSSVWPPGTKGDYPVVCIDWCDAYAYCKGVGKRLCGGIGGDATAFGAFADSNASQWYAACSSGGLNDYPYGDTYNAQTCNGENGSNVMAVGSKSSCVSSVAGYTGVYDLSGNVWEWEDSCNGNTGVGDSCRIRAGSSWNGSADLRCDKDNANARTYVNAGMGFRCCSEP